MHTFKPVHTLASQIIFIRAELQMALSQYKELEALLIRTKQFFYCDITNFLTPLHVKCNELGNKLDELEKKQLVENSAASVEDENNTANKES